MVELYNITYGGFINGDKVEPVKLLINDRYEEFRLQRLSFFLSFLYIYFSFLGGALGVVILHLTFDYTVCYIFFFLFLYRLTSCRPCTMICRPKRPSLMS